MSQQVHSKSFPEWCSIEHNLEAVFLSLYGMLMGTLQSHILVEIIQHKMRCNGYNR